MKKKALPPLPNKFEYRLDLRHHVTPYLLRGQPIHRWFYFPHSFSPQLIDVILEEYPVPKNARVLDPFVGAGTTILRAHQLGYSSTGLDLSPLSAFVCKAKLSTNNASELRKAKNAILKYQPIAEKTKFTNRMNKAFSIKELEHIRGIQKRITTVGTSPLFFQLALLKVQQGISRARPDGGWFRWVKKRDQSEKIKKMFQQRVETQIADLESNSSKTKATWRFIKSDARAIKKLDKNYGLIVTSPPYPNRHDYSRIFHIELLSLGVSESEIKAFRRSSIRSHVEAKDPRLKTNGYSAPKKLLQIISKIPANADPRIEPMLKGYFEDMYLTFKACNRLLSKNAVAVFVVGNVRHAGIMIPIDEILAKVAKKAGFTLNRAWVARLRGNSAQQMKQYGRKASRETILIFKKV